jgi:hypothetical protein
MPDPTKAVPATMNPPAGTETAKKEIKLISHSTLFYWWPVWAFGFFLAVWTYVEGDRLVVAPANGKIQVDQKSKVQTIYKLEYEVKGAFESDKESVTTPDLSKEGAFQVKQVFPARVSRHAWLGSMFIVVLLLTIFITNVPLRGLWSFLSIMGIVVIALLFSVFHVWDDFYTILGGLHVHINMAGYVFIALAILVIWIVAVYIFDRRTYIIFTPGQVKVCEHIGASVRTYDTVGLTFEKQRDDLFRHIILGFGSGDLIVRTAGAERAEIKIQNVLMIGSKIRDVENLLRERAVT